MPQADQVVLLVLYMDIRIGLLLFESSQTDINVQLQPYVQVALTASFV